MSRPAELFVDSEY